MKKISFLALVFFAGFVNAQQPEDKPFTLKGSVIGLADSAKIMLADAMTGAAKASAIAKDFKFEIQGSVPEPGLYSLVIPGFKPAFVFIEPGTVNVTGNLSEPNTLQVYGSKSHEDFSEFEKKFNPLLTDQNNLVNTIKQTPEGTNRDSLITVYTNASAVIQTAIDNYIDTKKNSYVSPFVLMVTARFSDDIMMLENRFNRLDESIKNSSVGKSLLALINDEKIGAIGTQAIDFTQPDTDGNPVSLSSFKGKYVLVDFWASWCRPCREENPNVVANYNKFKNKNFTVLGVSLDREGQKDKWLQAIKNDKLTWTHVSDLKFWENEAAQLYKVQSIPTNFLLDPNGKIIAKNLRGEELQSKLCEYLDCK